MNTQHTPGPWRFVADGAMDDDCNIPRVEVPPDFTGHDYGNNPSIEGPEGELVAGCGEYLVFGPDDKEVRAANVRLMIASPELLAALVKAETWVATYIRVEKLGEGGPCVNDLAEIRAAIAKATTPH